MKKFKIKNFINNENWKIKAKIIAILLIICLIVFDQFMKKLAQTKLSEYDVHALMPGFIDFQLVYNTGSAFGFFKNQTTGLIVIAFLMCFFIISWFIFSKTVSNIIGMSFILAGTIGNLLDRFLNKGRVVDFLYWELFDPRTIFNTADIMISLGIGIIFGAIVIKAIYNGILEKKLQKQDEENKVYEKNK